MLVAGQLDDVIPEEDIAAVREEVREAPGKNQANKQDAAGLRRKGRLRYPSEPVSDLVWMPKYAQHLAHPAVVAVAKAMLDDHLRIAQLCAQQLSSCFRQKRSRRCCAATSVRSA